MKNLSRALAFSACLSLTGMAASTAQATPHAAPISAPSAPLTLASLDSTPAPATPFASASRAQDAAPLRVAVFQSGCDDPDPWYMFSAIQAMTCVFSGQW
ncbi:MAG: hypothetical protein GAK43_00774 [Stenotrophomonas maltophilia]|nr:MAG: hypothetical protein GAK43_00774 [Stenotrophomonas maltophilia]